MRNTIVRKIASGWEPAPAFHLPTTVRGRERHGKPEGSPSVDTDITIEPEVLTSTQTLPPLEDTETTALEVITEETPSTPETQPVADERCERTNPVG